MVGCNSRLDTIQAAVLNVKLKRWTNTSTPDAQPPTTMIKPSRAHPKITTPFRAPYSHHVFHQYTLLLEGTDRNGLNEYLAAKGIPSMIYYPVPAHRQQMFAASGGAIYHLPTTDWLTERVISLPMHTELDEEQLHAISTAVFEYVDKK
jgi:UDP-2-acetamido-2-deoxy-ribo-hexuluronate aminotransferase